jgi:hypothetical protein
MVAWASVGRQWCSAAHYLRKTLEDNYDESLLRVHVGSGRLLVKLRVEITSKLLAQTRKGVFSLLQQLLVLSGSRSWWIRKSTVRLA